MLGATLCYMDTRLRLDVRMIGQRVAERRGKLRLEQTELAERAGLSRAYVSRLESGIVANPKVLDLERLAAALGTTVAAILATDDSPARAVRISECADIFGQLDSEPPEVAETILRWLRESVEIARSARLARTN